MYSYCLYRFKEIDHRRIQNIIILIKDDIKYNIIVTNGYVYHIYYKLSW